MGQQLTKHSLVCEARPSCYNDSLNRLLQCLLVQPSLKLLKPKLLVVQTLFNIHHRGGRFFRAFESRSDPNFFELQTEVIKLLIIDCSIESSLLARVSPDTGLNNLFRPGLPTNLKPHQIQHRPATKHIIPCQHL